MKKKQLLGMVAVVFLMTACGNSEANTKSEQKSGTNTLVVSTFGLSEDIVKTDIIAPFEQKNEAKVTLDIGNSSDRYTKLVANPNAGIDVIELAQSNATQGEKEGLFETITEKEVPAIQQLTDGAKEVYESGAGIPVVVNSIGIVYNKEKVGKELTSWDDLWSADLKGKLSVPDISTTAGPLFLYIASEHAGTDITSDKGVAGFEAMEELKPNVVKTYSKSSDLANMFQSGEIVAAVVADFAVDIIQNASEGVEYFVPESGTYANYNTINVPKKAKNKELAYAFVDYRISENSQKTKALSLNEGPTNKNVTLDEAQAKHKTYGKVAQQAKMVDFAFINEQMSSWVDQWNRIMNQ